MIEASQQPDTLLLQLMQMANQLPQTAKDEINQILAPIATQGALHGLSPETLETIYSVAYSMYQSSQYEKAREIFQTLTMLDHFEYKYLFGLASCYQMQKSYQQAVETYAHCFLLEPNDPAVPFYSAYCHMMLKQYDAAASGFDAAIRWAGEQAQFAEIKERAISMLALVKRKKASA